MVERRLNRGLAMILTLCLMIPVAIALAEDDGAQMKAYWHIVGNTAQNDPLTRAMNGAYDDLTLAELTAIMADDLLAFSAANRLPAGMTRYAYYSALADRLAAEADAMYSAETTELLVLFLAMKDAPRDKTANAQRRDIRKALTEADIHAYAAETGLPAGFLAWLLLDDEWYEPDWDDGDDWREGRRTWDFADWVDAADLREKYGKDAVVTEDDVEWVLRQNGIRIDD